MSLSESELEVADRPRVAEAVQRASQQHADSEVMRSFPSRDFRLGPIIVRIEDSSENRVAQEFVECLPSAQETEPHFTVHLSDEVGGRITMVIETPSPGGEQGDARSTSTVLARSACAPKELRERLSAALSFAAAESKILLFEGLWLRVNEHNILVVASDRNIGTLQDVRTWCERGAEICASGLLAVDDTGLLISDSVAPEIGARIDAVVIVEGGEANAKLRTTSSKDAKALLDCAICGPFGCGLVDPRSSFLGAALLARSRRAQSTALANLVAGCPSATVSVAGLQALASPAALLDVVELGGELIDDELKAEIRKLQQVVNDLYGRMDGNRALVWVSEELGEFIQAVRRKEGGSRITEELGQLLALVLCLGNINGVDVADAIAMAVQHEAQRQERKHGSLRADGASER
jgi:NTP pyrophosphatase (non-canonical NTP hydrolase)